MVYLRGNYSPRSWNWHDGVIVREREGVWVFHDDDRQHAHGTFYPWTSVVRIECRP